MIPIPCYGVTKDKNGTYQCDCGSGSGRPGTRDSCKKGKHPCVRGWNLVDSPQAGVDLVAQALRRSSNINLAVLTGASGLLVVDLDVKKGDDGKELVNGIDEFVKIIGDQDLPDSPSQISGGGGRHIPFSVPLAVSINLLAKTDLGNGVELKSGMSLIHVYPSRHSSGKLYKWEVEPGFKAHNSIQNAPDWLIKLAQGESKTSGGVELDVPVTRDELLKLAKKWTNSNGVTTGRAGRVLSALLHLDTTKPKTVEALKEVLPDGSRQVLLGLTQALGERYMQVKAERILEQLEPALKWRAEQGSGTTLDEVKQMLVDAQRKVLVAKSGWRSSLTFTDGGAIQATGSNIKQILSHHRMWDDVLAYDERRQRIVYLKEPPIQLSRESHQDLVYPLEFQEWDLMDIMGWLSLTEGVNAPKLILMEALEASARKRKTFDPVRDEYFEKLSWDGVPRLDEWLITYGNAADNPYIRAIGAKTLIAAVARTYDPGCKADHVLILEGPQGVRKSTLLATLVPRRAWFTDHLPDLHNKDAMLQLSGKLIIEISELSAVRRSAQERVKSFITSATDTYRPPYGRVSADFPRRCIFVGSTNEEFYMVDNTGNRRYWPVKIYQRIPSAKIEQLALDRDQIWAEAVARYKGGELPYLSGDFERVAKSEQSAREEVELDPWVGRLRTILADARTLEEETAPAKEEKDPFAKVDSPRNRPVSILRGFIRTTDLLDALEVDLERQNTGAARRLAACMRKLGWILHKRNGTMGYIRKDGMKLAAE